MQNLNLEITGNPFIDSGIYALKSKLNKDIKEISFHDLENELEFIADLYAKPGWRKNMYSIFPNSILTNPTFVKMPNLKDIYLDTLNKLICTIVLSNDGDGNCMGCGRRDSIELYGKDYIPLSGSGSLINFFPFASKGANYCPLCVLLIQFSPLLMYKCGQKLILLHSNSSKVMDIWSRKVMNNISDQVSSKQYSGCYNHDIKIPLKGIFDIINQILDNDVGWKNENPSLNFYYFTNYNLRPQLDIFEVKPKVFNFLIKIPPDEVNNWKFIIRNTNNDELYEYLLSDKSLLKFFYDSEYGKVYCSWKLVKIYLKEIFSINNEIISAIEILGEKLSKCMLNEDSSKILQKIEKIVGINNFKEFINSYSGKFDKQLLIDYKEDLLINEDKYWGVIYNSLLFRIYECYNNFRVHSIKTKKNRGK